MEDPIGESRLPFIQVLQWGHAEHSVEDSYGANLYGANLYGFNGATLSTAWKTPTRVAASHSLCVLQWGHAEHSVEDIAGARWARSPAALQWGHAEHSVEDRRTRSPRLEAPHASMGPR